MCSSLIGVLIINAVMKVIISNIANLIDYTYRAKCTYVRMYVAYTSDRTWISQYKINAFNSEGKKTLLNECHYKTMLMNIRMHL